MVQAIAHNASDLGASSAVPGASSATKDGAPPTRHQLLERYRRALADVTLPAAFVDLDALDENIARLLAPVRQGGKTLRLATKSIRCPAIARYIVEHGDGLVRGVMTYAAAETAFLVGEGETDALLAYPTAQAADVAQLAEANLRAVASVVVDDADQLGPLSRAATAAGTTIPVVVEIDVAFRPLGFGHLGVRRSPLRTAPQVVALAEKIRATPSLRFHGVMAYEAHIAGLTDHGPHAAWQNPVKRLLKRAARGPVERTRAALIAALAARGLAPTVVNGAGTGSLHWASREPDLTEVTAGSGFLDSQLFDYYADLALVPAAWFALQVVRRPAPGVVTCHGGGFVASGAACPDKLPVPSLPEGCALLPMEGAGEVQTPVRLPRGVDVAVGEPIFFRHAKAGELAEHFNEYLLVRGDAVVARVPTYRGLGRCFLG